MLILNYLYFVARKRHQIISKEIQSTKKYVYVLFGIGYIIVAVWLMMIIK